LADGDSERDKELYSKMVQYYLKHTTSKNSC